MDNWNFGFKRFATYNPLYLLCKLFKHNIGLLKPLGEFLVGQLCQVRSSSSWDTQNLWAADQSTWGYTQAHWGSTQAPWGSTQASWGLLNPASRESHNSFRVKAPVGILIPLEWLCYWSLFRCGRLLKPLFGWKVDDSVRPECNSQGWKGWWKHILCIHSLKCKGKLSFGNQMGKIQQKAVHTRAIIHTAEVEVSKMSKSSILPI